MPDTQPFPCMSDARLTGNHAIVTCMAQRMNLDAIFDSVGEAILTVGRNGVVTHANRKATDLLAMDRDEIVGMQVENSVGRLIPDFPEILKSVLRDEKPVRELSLEYSYADDASNSPRSFVVSMDFLRAHADPELRDVVVAIIRDTTELYQLRREQLRLAKFQRLIGRSKPMEEVYDLIEHVAPTEATVLIRGESGTGKELAAQSIHDLSRRASGPFIKVNCAALVESLLESELFGHVRGAYTGAIRDRVGRFELAKGGTIFLDEIGDLSPAVQVKLLRVLQEREIERVGESEPRKVDVRVIAATHHALEEQIEADKFRQDLYYRLRVVDIRLPPLREHRSDIPLLVNHFVEKFNASYSKPITGVSAQTLEYLTNYGWPGNVRELENAIEHAFVLCDRARIAPSHLPPEIRGRRTPPRDSERMTHLREGPLADFDANGDGDGDEKALIIGALERAGGRIVVASELLQMHRTTLWRKMLRYGIDRAQKP